MKMTTLQPTEEQRRAHRRWLILREQCPREQCESEPGQPCKVGRKVLSRPHMGRAIAALEAGQAAQRGRS